VAQKYQEATWQEALIAFLEEVTTMTATMTM
jgi:hypothetical protein